MIDSFKTISFFLLAGLGLMAAGAAIGGLMGYDKGKRSCPECPGVSVDTTVTIDSADYPGTAVRPDADSLIFVDSAPYPVPNPQFDTIVEHDTTIIYVNLPYEHRLFEMDDTLKLWYSGVDPRIDSIKIYMRNSVVTNNVIRTESRMPRLTVELGAGALYTEKAVEPYLVGKVSYNARKTTFSGFGVIDNKGVWGAGVNVTYRFSVVK